MAVMMREGTRIGSSSKSTARLKARILSDVLEDNLDVIHGRVPQSLRPMRRRLRLWGGRLAFVVLIVAASAGVARWPAAAPAEPLEPAGRAHSAQADRASTPVPGTVRALHAATLDASLLSQPMPPGVLDLSVRRVVVDAGHGGDNPGTSSESGVKEKEITLDIAARVQQLLAARGFETVMTRTADQTLSLQQRATTANGRRGDIFVSIHLNSFPRPEARGIETYYLGPGHGADLDAIAAAENQNSGYSLSDMRSMLERIYTDARRDESKRLADSIQQSLIGSLRKGEPALPNRGVKMAPFVVLSATEMPAILAEVSWLSNEEQAQRLKKPEAQQIIAEALVSGIETFARQSRVTAAERTGSYGR